MNATLGASILLWIVQAAAGGRVDQALTMGLVLGSMAIGVVSSVPIGGADMPVLIPLLNATADMAASLCGIAAGGPLLIACGSTVAASGSILTDVMCRAMNRAPIGVFTGIPAATTESASAAESGTERQPEKPCANGGERAKRRRRVVGSIHSRA